MVPTSPRKKAFPLAQQQQQQRALPSALKGKGLNPRAPTFNFSDQKPSRSPAVSGNGPTGQSREHASGGAKSYAAATRQASAGQQQSTSNTASSSQYPSPILQNPSPSLNGHSHAQSLASSQHSAAPSSSSASAPAPLTTTHISPTHSRPTTLRRSSSRDSASSVSSSSSSTSSCCSLLPTLASFRRAHYLQFALSALLCLAVALGLGLWKKEVRVWEVGLGAAAWLAAEGLKEVVFELFGPKAVPMIEDAEVDEEAGSPSPSRSRRAVATGVRGLGIPTAVHAILQEGIRLGAICCMVALLPDPVPSPQASSLVFATSATAIIPSIPPPHPPGRRPRTLPPLDTLFFSALWMGLGWAVIEIVWASRDFWRRMALYEDVLLDDEARIRLAEGDREEDELEWSEDEDDGDKQPEREELSDSAFDRHTRRRELRSMQELDAELEARQRELEREEVEGQLGVPLWEIPVAVVLVWRLDSILLSLLLTLLLSLPFRTTSPSLIPFPLLPTFIAGASIHAFLSLLWCLRIKHVGIAAVSYSTLVGLIMGVFAVGAAWGALE